MPETYHILCYCFNVWKDFEKLLHCTMTLLTLNVHLPVHSTNVFKNFQMFSVVFEAELKHYEFCLWQVVCSFCPDVFHTLNYVCYIWKKHSILVHVLPDILWHICSTLKYHDTLSFTHWKWPANIFHINNKLDFVFVLPPTLKNVQHSVCTHIFKLKCLTNYA